jgi:hypothetical protein
MFTNIKARIIRLFDIILEYRLFLWNIGYFYGLKNATILRYLITDPKTASCDEGAGLGGRSVERS